MIRRALALILLVPLAFAGCDLIGTDDNTSIGRPTPGPTRPGPGRLPLKIGLVGSMGGPEGWRGEDAYEGADLGLHQVNRQMADDARRYELQVLDDGGDPDLAAEHLRSLLRGDVVGVIYAGPPEGLADAENLLRRAQVPVIALYGDLYGAQKLSSHLFQVAPPFEWQARDIARYLTRDRGYEKVGVLAESESNDGEVAAGAMEEQLRNYGIGSPVVASYEKDTRPALERLKRARVEAVVVQGDPDRLGSVFAELRGLGAIYRGTPSARIASAPRRLRMKRLRKDWWHPQIAGFDLMVNERGSPPPPGTVAVAPYSRGVHYLPVPSFGSFREAFRDWWDDVPLGYERRAYEATLALGWAAEREQGEDDVAARLEDLRSRRFGGSPVTLGPDDHLFVEEVTLGLWTVPSPGDRVLERERLPEELPWVPLARGFSIDGETTDILSSDWKYLFYKPPPPDGPAPKFARLRFGVRTPRSDPLR